MRDYLKWNKLHQISEIGTEAFMRNKSEKFGFYRVFRGKNMDCVPENHVQFSREYDVDRSVNSALSYVKDETVLDSWIDEIKLLSSLMTPSFAISSVIPVNMR